MRNRPEGIESTQEPIYSNFDHCIDSEVEEELKINPNKLYAQHATWNFCGYIYFTGSFWVEEIWRYNVCIATYQDKDLAILICTVNAEHGEE